MKKTTKNSNLRIIGLYLLVFLLAVGVVVKIVKVQQFDELINTTSQPRFFTVEAPRGNILADDGSLLAISMPLYKIYLDLSVISKVLFDKHIVEMSEGLSDLFADKSAEEYEQFLRLAKKSRKNKYVLLKLKVTHNELKVLQSLPVFKLGQNRGGLIAEQRPHREVPFGLLAQRTVGVLRDVNPVGIEVAFNQVLLPNYI